MTFPFHDLSCWITWIGCATSTSLILEAEWQAIVRRASPDARVIWRSGGAHTDFVERVEVDVEGTLRRVGELLTYHRDLAEELHEKDRVHTYGSFHIADLAA